MASSPPSLWAAELDKLWRWGCPGGSVPRGSAEHSVWWVRAGGLPKYLSRHAAKREMAEMKGEARSPEGGLLLWGSSTHITNRSVRKFPNVPRLRQELPTSADTQKLLPFLLSLFLCPTSASSLVWGQNTSEKILDSRVFYLHTFHSVAQVDKVFGNKPSSPNQRKTWYLLPGSQRLLDMVLETNKIQMLPEFLPFRPCTPRIILLWDGQPCGAIDCGPLSHTQSYALT